MPPGAAIPPDIPSDGPNSHHCSLPASLAVELDPDVSHRRFEDQIGQVREHHNEDPAFVENHTQASDPPSSYNGIANDYMSQAQPSWPVDTPNSMVQSYPYASPPFQPPPQPSYLPTPYPGHPYLHPPIPHLDPYQQTYSYPPRTSSYGTNVVSPSTAPHSASATSRHESWSAPVTDPKFSGGPGRVPAHNVKGKQRGAVTPYPRPRSGRLSQGADDITVIPTSDGYVMIIHVCVGESPAGPEDAVVP
ncbi:hypothetical protein OF83DRAFT_351682 [Amylostereum chailletii]|nr:hypothetical protein OF83DRAFT_351682 [Amylostereum chailletii]